MRYEALGPGIDEAPSKTSSTLVNFISHSLCMYVCGVNGFRVYDRLLNFISASRCVWGSEGLGAYG